MEVEDIAKEIKKIVDSAELRAIREHGENWKEKYEWLVEILRGIRSDAELLREDYKQNGLSFSAIEAEGFLRCAITVCNEIDRVESAYTKST